MDTKTPLGGERHINLSFRDVLTSPGTDKLIELLDDYNVLQDFVPSELTVNELLVRDLTVKLAAAQDLAEKLAKGAPLDAPVLAAIIRRLQGQLQVVGYLSHLQALPAQPPPKLLHFCWSGDELRSSARDNILAWAELARRSGWTVLVWTDAQLKGWTAKNGKQLTRSGVKIIELDESKIDPRLWKAYLAIVRGKKPNYPAGSDLARYSILLQHGGVYIDVDIAPGALYDLDRLATPVRLPLQAPEIRDRARLYGELRLRLKKKNDNDNDKDEKEITQPLTQAHIDRVARSRLAAGAYNNNFIVCPAKDGAMDAIVGHVAVKLADGLEILLDEPSNAAFLTGPGQVKTALIQYVARQLKISQEAAVDIVTLALNHNLPLGWVTPESESQEH